MKDLKYLRKNKTIINAENKEVIETFDSINAAKRHSVNLQLKTDSGLGLGCLKVVS